MEIQTIEFHTNGAHFFSRRVIVARAWTKHDGLSKVRNRFWLGREGQTLICVGCRPDSQSRKQNRWRKCAPFLSQRPLAHFWTDIRFGNFPACRSGVYLVFQKQLKTKRFRRPGPARNRCVSGLGRDVFFGGRSRERSVLSFLVLSLQNRSAPFSRKKRGGSRKHQK